MMFIKQKPLNLIISFWKWAPVLQILTGKFLPHRFLFSPLFCWQQPTEIGFHIFPWNLLYALRAAEGQEGKQSSYSSPGHISWGLRTCGVSSAGPWFVHVHGGIWSGQYVVDTHMGQSLWAPCSVLQKHDGKNRASQMVLVLPLLKWCNFQYNLFTELLQSGRKF